MSATQTNRDEAGPVSPDPAGVPDPVTALGLLMEVQGGLERRLRAQLEDHGVALAEWEVLVRLGRSTGERLRMSDAAAQVSLSTSGLTRLADRLEDRDLVRREACPTDRRGSFLVLTEAGHALVGEVLPGHRALIERWYTGLLSDDQLAGLIDALRTLRATLHPQAVAGTEGTEGPGASGDA